MDAEVEKGKSLPTRLPLAVARSTNGMSEDNTSSAMQPTGRASSTIQHQASARLPSRFGEFTVHAFLCEDGQEYGSVVHGAIDGADGVLTRLHSECFTGDIMGSLRCDCGR